MITSIIIDDEFLARKRLEKLLENNSFVKIIGEAKNGKEAIDLIRNKSPDLLFLDIQMPEMNGFEVLEKIDKNAHIIFTTAYDQYAIKAFEENAVDYLLKPFDIDRLNQAVDKVRKVVKSKRSVELEEKFALLLKTYQALDSSYLETFTIKEKGREIHVLADEVYYLKSEGNYISIKTDSRKYLLRQSMNQVESELNPSKFLRIHRSYIVNTNFIVKTIYRNNNEYELELTDGSVLVSGRTYKSRLDDYLNDSNH